MSLQEYKNLLSEYISFKSVSTDKAYASDIQQTATWLTNLFNNAKFDTQIFQGSNSNPVVFASYKVLGATETVLVYGHYDVQPAVLEDGWDGEPFVVTEKDGKLIARGIVDNKGQNLIHIYTVLNLIKEGNLKYNVKFLIEGNEETSNEDLGNILAEQKELLKTDYIIVSDGEVANYKPTVEASLRGGLNSKLTFTTSNNNHHSGLYGGAIPNAAYELSKFLAGLFDENNQVTVSGFYDGVDEIIDEQLENNKKLTDMDTELLEKAGVKSLLTEKTDDGNYDFYTQVGLRPTIQVTGIKSGYIGEGYANIVPATAEARLNFRLVMSQEPVAVIAAFEAYLKSKVPDYVDYEWVYTEPYNAIKIDISSPKVAEVKKLLAKAYDDEVVVKHVGGGIPIVNDFKDILGVDTMLISFGNDDCNMHGANENFDIGLLEKALKFSKMFFSK